MFKKVLAAEFEPYGALSKEQLNQLEAHYLSLTRWNERLNLTRIVGLSESVKFHYCESLFLAQYLPAGPLRVVDIGSGAGFPGIPLAIFRPDCEVTLVEAHQRKSVFLRESSRELKNVKVIPKRAELITNKFDWLVSRAVSPSEVLSLDVADSIALLISGEDSSGLAGESKPIPWGNQRVLFHVKRESQSDH